MCCEKCGKMLGMLIIVVGILFLLRDLNVWNFWNIQWYSVLFILGGFGFCCHHCCGDVCTTKKKK